MEISFSLSNPLECCHLTKWWTRSCLCPEKFFLQAESRRWWWEWPNRTWDNKVLQWCQGWWMAVHLPWTDFLPCLMEVPLILNWWWWTTAACPKTLKWLATTMGREACYPLWSRSTRSSATPLTKLMACRFRRTLTWLARFLRTRAPSGRFHRTKQ